MALPQAKLDATETRLAAMALPSGGAWITAVRDAALARVREMGLPGRRDEYWKFTRPDTLVEPQAPTAALFSHDEGMPFDDMDRVRVVFVDGVFDAAASDDLTAAGIEIERLETAAAQDIHWARDLYGVLEEKGQYPVMRPLAALNNA